MKNAMKILIIFTGGTIGSSVKNGYISVDKDNMARLLCEAGAYADCGSDENKVEAELEIINPYTILSETLDGTHIAALVRCINENIARYDGVIVCHGTDTLQYTAAALGFSFADSCVPIVLASSNYVLDDERANGRANLKAALEFITGHSSVPGLSNRMRRGGVWVSYKNENEPPLLYEPFSLLPHQPYDDRLYSLKGDENIGVEFDSRRMNEACLKLKKESGVLWIKAYPGISYQSFIKADGEKPSCILLDSYHSGTINTSDEGLLKLSDWAKKNAVPICLIGLEPGISYETTGLYEALGIKPLPKLSPIAAYMYEWITGGKTDVG